MSLRHAPVNVQLASTPESPTTRAVQLRRLESASAGAPARPLQYKGGGDPSGSAHTAAASGIKGSAGKLPYGDAIQKSFGRHDVSNVQAHVGGDAAQANEQLGAQAYASGDHVAFKSGPDLHTAAHEAAHVVQQKAGVSLKGGIGESGDKYEQHADQVADAVVQGKSAEPILDTMAGSGGGGGGLQRSVVQCDLGDGAAKGDAAKDKGAKGKGDKGKGDKGKGDKPGKGKSQSPGVNSPMVDEGGVKTPATFDFDGQAVQIDPGAVGECSFGEEEGDTIIAEQVRASEVEEAADAAALEVGGIPDWTEMYSEMKGHYALMKRQVNADYEFMLRDYDVSISEDGTPDLDDLFSQKKEQFAAHKPLQAALESAEQDMEGGRSKHVNARTASTMALRQRKSALEAMKQYGAADSKGEISQEIVSAQKDDVMAARCAADWEIGVQGLPDDDQQPLKTAVEAFLTQIQAYDAAHKEGRIAVGTQYKKAQALKKGRADGEMAKIEETIAKVQLVAGAVEGLAMASIGASSPMDALRQGANQVLDGSGVSLNKGGGGVSSSASLGINEAGNVRTQIDDSVTGPASLDGQGAAKGALSLLSGTAVNVTKIVLAERITAAQSAGAAASLALNAIAAVDEADALQATMTKLLVAARDLQTKLESVESEAAKLEKAWYEHGLAVDNQLKQKTESAEGKQRSGRKMSARDQSLVGEEGLGEGGERARGPTLYAGKLRVEEALAAAAVEAWQEVADHAANRQRDDGAMNRIKRSTNGLEAIKGSFGLPNNWANRVARSKNHIAELEGGRAERSQALAQFDVLTSSGSNLCDQLPPERRADKPK